MGSLWDRLILDDGEPRLAGEGLPSIADAIRWIEEGRSAASLGLAPPDCLTVLAVSALGGLNSPGPPLVQREPPRPALRSALDETGLAELFPDVDRPSRLALGAGLLQVHDFWDASHQAAQAADDLGESGFSAYWHGIAHRREPDAGNALYWFRRVGQHPLFPALCDAARPIVQEHGDDALAGWLLGPGGWNPGAMIDLCVGARPGTPRAALARRLQRLEMQLLLDATAAAMSAS
jgi:hypothetical protein